MEMKNKTHALLHRMAILVLMAALFLTPVLAEENTIYKMPTLDIQLEMPESYPMVTSGDTTGKDAGDTKEDVEDVYLHVNWGSEDGVRNYRLTVRDWGQSDLEYINMTEDELQAELDFVVGYFDKDYEILESDVHFNSHTNFVRVSYTDGTDYWKANVTAHNQKYIIFEVCSYKNPLNDSASGVLSTMVGTVRLLTVPPTPAPTAEPSAAPAAEDQSSAAPVTTEQSAISEPEQEAGGEAAVSEPEENSGEEAEESGKEIDQHTLILIGVIVACIIVILVVLIVLIRKGKKKKKHVGTIIVEPAPEPETKYCSGCGAEAAPGTRFCGICGTEIE